MGRICPKIGHVCPDFDELRLVSAHMLTLSTSEVSWPAMIVGDFAFGLFGPHLLDGGRAPAGEGTA